MLSLKVTFNGDTRRINYSAEVLTWDKLSNEIKTRFGIDATIRIIVTYVDLEGDRVSVSSDVELSEAITQSQGSAPLKFEISTKEPFHFSRLPPAYSEVVTSPIQPTIIPQSSEEAQSIITNIDEKKSTTSDMPSLENLTISEPSTTNKPKEETQQQTETVKVEQNPINDMDIDGSIDKQTEEAPKEESKGKAKEEQPTINVNPQVISSDSDSSKLEHSDVVCNGCNSKIFGIRYKCGHCPDFDFCESCEASYTSTHHPAHIFLKMRYPILLGSDKPWYNRGVCLLPKVVINTPQQNKSTLTLSNESNSTQPNVVQQETSFSRIAPLKSLVESEIIKAQSLETIVAPSPQDNLNSEFIRDITIPDGTIVSPGVPILKQWIFRNSGNVKWPAGTTLKLLNICGQPKIEEQSVSLINIPNPGETVEISVYIIPPQEPGRYIYNYRLVTNQKQRFGHRVWCDIIVQHPEQPKQQPPQVQQPTMNVDNNVDQQPSPSPSSTSVFEAEPEPESDVHFDPNVIEMDSLQHSVLLPSEEDSFDSQMFDLISMGFKDRTSNLRKLRKHNGNINAAVEELVMESSQEWED